MNSTVTEKKLIDIVKAYIKNEFTDNKIIGEEFDFDALYELSNTQKLAPMVYYTLTKSNVLMPIDVIAKFKKNYLYFLKISLKQDNVIKKLEKYLGDKKISYAFFKGAELRSYFTPSEVRTMSDIDILAADKDKTSIIKDLCDKDDKPEYYNHVHSCHIEGVLVEMHGSVEYFYKTIVTVNDITEDNKLQPTKHLVLLLAHIAGHIEQGGCGLRQFIDIAVYLQRYDSKIDWAEFDRLMTDIDKLAFGKTIIYLIKYWFDIDCGANYYDLDNDIINNSEFIDEMRIFLCSNGVYGKDDAKSLGETRIAKESGKFPRLKALSKLALPPYEAMVKIYPKLESKKWLIGWYYLDNIFRKLTKQNKLAKSVIKGIMTGGDSVSKRAALLNKLHLK